MLNDSIAVPDFKALFERGGTTPIPIESREDLVGTLSLLNDLGPKNSMQELRRRVRLRLIGGGKSDQHAADPQFCDEGPFVDLGVPDPDVDDEILRRSKSRARKRAEQRGEREPDYLDEDEPPPPGDEDGPRSGPSTNGFESKQGDGANSNQGENPEGSPQKYFFERAIDIVPLINQRALIKNIVPIVALGIIFGKSNSGKSFVAIDMAVAIAAGIEWLGHKTTSGKVIYVTAESPTGLRNRLYARLQHLSLEDRERIADRIHVVSTVVRLNQQDADVPEFVRDVTSQLGGHVDLIIIDTLSQAMPGKNENGPDDMTAAVAASQTLRDLLQATVLLVHHSGKDQSKGSRGHTSLTAAADFELEIEADKPGPDAIRTLKMTKQRDGKWMKSIGFRLVDFVLGDDDDGEEVTTATIESCEATGKPTKGRRVNLAEAARTAVLDMMKIKSVEVPRAVLAESTYLDWMKEHDWDLNIKVVGVHRADAAYLLKERYDPERDKEEAAGADAGVDEPLTRPATDKRREEDRLRKAAERRINKAIDAGLLWAHGDYLWTCER